MFIHYILGVIITFCLLSYLCKFKKIRSEIGPTEIRSLDDEDFLIICLLAYSILWPICLSGLILVCFVKCIIFNIFKFIFNIFRWAYKKLSFVERH
jgi:hypothetical protein